MRSSRARRTALSSRCNCAMRACRRNAPWMRNPRYTTMRTVPTRAREWTTTAIFASARSELAPELDPDPGQVSGVGAIGHHGIEAHDPRLVERSLVTHAQAD